MINLSLISILVAEQLNQHLMLHGVPTENRIVIATSKEKSSKSGLIIPTNVEEGIPRKGVIVQAGTITEENTSLRDKLVVGNIVNYGAYAGKEIEVDADWLNDSTTLRVLSLNEVIYIEFNK